jgi:hypothetical protein
MMNSFTPLSKTSFRFASELRAPKLASLSNMKRIKPVCFRCLRCNFSAIQVYCLWGLLLLPGCQSSGQENSRKSAGGGFRPRREVPKAVLDALPVQPDTVLQTTHFQLLVHGTFDYAPIEKYADRLEKAVVAIRDFTGSNCELPLLRCHFYQSAEEKGLLTGNHSQAHILAEKNELHAVLAPVYEGIPSGQELELLLKILVGDSPKTALRCGLAVYFSPDWQGAGHSFWVKKLGNADALPSLTELLENDHWEHCSNLVAGAIAASFVEFLIKKWGKTAFLKQYLTWNLAPDQLAELESEWRKHVADLPENMAQIATVRTTLPFFKGFNFAHEGYALYNGYGSRMAGKALDYLANLNTNAVAIVPYSYLRTPASPTPFPVMKRAGTENDEAVVQTCYDARQRGMSVMMKPQIWVGHHQWTGDIAMKTEADWQAFFHYYTHWILHYAFLAEVHRCEVLCIGTELVQTTLQREADWRVLIQKIRAVYSGKLVYAANWGEEFEKINFWDQLDYIGLDCYYPLHDKEDASEKELRKGFQSIVQRIEKVQQRFHKPLIFTEIGFPSCHAPWRQPHHDGRDAAFNAEHQRRCYEVVFEALQGKPWCGGLFWWKFPSHLEIHRSDNTGFTPFNKPAETVVKNWFGKI